MPDEEFEGDRSFGLGTLLVGAPLAYAGFKIVRGASGAFKGAVTTEGAGDPFAKVVSGKYRGYFQALEGWSPPVAATPIELHEMILESFRRRLGGGDLAAGIG